MASFAPIRGTKQQIENTPMVDGQFLVETDQGDQNKTYIDSYDSNNQLQRTMCGGGGHEILPNPKNTSTPPNEERVVEAVNGAPAASEKIASLYGMQNWSNRMTKRVMYSGTIAKGATGIGYYPDDAEYEALLQMSVADRLALESAPYDGSDPTNGYGWWSSNDFINPNVAHTGDMSTDDDVDIAIMFDPYAGQEPLVLGGYIIDTDTGCMCIKFGKSTGTATHKVGVDLTITRNNVN